MRTELPDVAFVCVKSEPGALLPSDREAAPGVGEVGDIALSPHAVSSDPRMMKRARRAIGASDRCYPGVVAPRSTDRGSAPSMAMTWPELRSADSRHLNRGRGRTCGMNIRRRRTRLNVS